MKHLNKKFVVIICLAVIVIGIYLLAKPHGFDTYVSDTNFKFAETEGGIVLTDYLGENESLIIPDEIDGKKVIALNGTFCTDSKIKNVRIPEGVRSIDYMTFWHCISLEKIEMPDSMVSIGNAAFEGCISLKKVKMGKNVKEILPYAFRACYLLERAELNDGLEFIGENAFADCVKLRSCNIPASVRVIGGVSGKSIECQTGSTEGSSFTGCEKLALSVDVNNQWYYGKEIR